LELQDVVQRITKQWEDYNRNYPYGELPSLTFHICGSFSIDQQRTRLSEAFAATLEEPPPIPETRPLVLVVDDDRDVVQGLSIRLKAQGYDVITAYDGAAGVSAANDRHPDAIVMDIRMPGMDGVAAVGELKRNPKTQHTPVVMLSASVRDQQRALEMGVSYFIPKPYTASAVMSAIESSMLHVVV
jgi:CheY-like chemotaxis protein